MPSLEAEAARIFLEAVEEHERGHWDEFVRGASSGDPELLKRVNVLLKAHDESHSILQPGQLLATVDTTESSERPGTMVGPYKLLEQIGEGGMGLVFVAEQQLPVRRTVALKVIKPGMDSKQVIARFEAERQAVALMDHPNIAKVLDAGTTDAGRPYFVMELVRGIPITEYCDQARLTLRQRLEVFVQVCRAVQHAHTKGVIHRDLKPSNVLVTSDDGIPVPLVIDFGVAKALGQQLTEHTLHTAFAQMVGTPLYMSPEQAEFNQLGVDTRSDIYSLGVLLYELLTGVTPFDQERLRTLGHDEFRRILREEEPPRPSTRLSTLDAAALSTVSQRRSAEPRRLTHALHGELDWIVLKSLEKDRTRRYETASAFAADVERYLKDETVEACPPSLTYRLRKFTRRNKPGLLVASALFALFAVLTGGVGWVVRDRAARQGEAERRGGDALTQAEAYLEQEDWPEGLRAIEQADAFLGGFAPGTPIRMRASQLRRELQMGQRLEEAHLVGANVKDEHFDSETNVVAYAEAFLEYGLDIDALEPLEAAAQIRARPIRWQLVAALDDWAHKSRGLEGRKHLIAVARAADPDPWRNRLRDVLESPDTQALEELIASAPIGELQVPALELLAETAQKIGSASDRLTTLLLKEQRRHSDDFWINELLAQNLAQSQPPNLEEAIRFHTAAVALRPHSPGARLNLGRVLYDKGQLSEAISEFREAIRLKKDYAEAHNNLGISLFSEGHLDEAIYEFREAIRLKKDSADSHYNLGNVLDEKGQLDEAMAEFREAIRLKKDYAKAHNNLGKSLASKGQRDEAMAEYREAIRLKKDLVEAHLNLGGSLRVKGQLDEAVAELREAIKLKKGYPEAHFALGSALYDKGQLDEAIAEYREAIRLKKDYAKAHNSLGGALYDKGQLDEAIAELREAIRQKKDFAEAHSNLGSALANKRQLDEAIAEFREAIRLKKDFAEAHSNLGHVLADKGQLDEAIAESREAIRLKKDYAEAHSNLGHALADKGQLDEAIAELREAIRHKKDFAEAHSNLGSALANKGQLDEAIAELRKAIRLKNDYAEAHYNLGHALADKGQLDEAIAESREAIRLKKDYAKAHSGLGIALANKGQLDEAIAEFREAIRLKKDHAEAHYNLGLVFRTRGQFAEALSCVRRAHELPSKTSREADQIAQAFKECEHLVELDAKLPAILAGKQQPADARERIDYARLCQIKQQNASAARLFGEAFAVQPGFAEDLASLDRYNAACAAALAGCGQGKDAAGLEEKERGRLRSLASDWLKADLEAWRRAFEKDPGNAGPVVVQQLQHWLEDSDFSGVHGVEALAKLPEAERQSWQKLWTNVAETVAKIQRKAAPKKKLDMK